MPKHKTVILKSPRISRVSWRNTARLQVEILFSPLQPKMTFVWEQPDAGSWLPGGNASRVPVSLNCRVVSACLMKHELLPSFKMRDLNIIRCGFPSATAINFALICEDRDLGWWLWTLLSLSQKHIHYEEEHLSCTFELNHQCQAAHHSDDSYFLLFSAF